MCLCVGVFVGLWLYANAQIWFCGFMFLWKCGKAHTHYAHYQSYSSFTVISTPSFSLIRFDRMGRMQYLVFIPARVTAEWGVKE